MSSHRSRDDYDIVPATLGESVVVHGALAIARDALTAYALVMIRSRCAKANLLQFHNDSGIPHRHP